MTTLDAAAIAEQAIKLRLLSRDQVELVWAEADKKGDAERFLRVCERKGFVTPWQSSKLLKGEKDGFFLGGYRILYKIASGSFGKVYRADDPISRRVVAIKVLRRKWSENKKAIELFMREGKMGTSLRHPNIVEVLSVAHDRASKQHFIAMEFVEGGNLREIMKIRHKLGPAEALRVLEECAAGLSYAFGQGITHRDMKPSNVLVSSQGTAKLVDFGLAEVRDTAEGAADDIGVDHTVDYIGLEQATGVPPGDTRSDIFFLGCVAYQMFTGRFPLQLTRQQARNVKARMAPERFTNIKPIAREEVGGHASIPRLVENMMTLNAEQRFQTPARLLEAVREVRREVEGKTEEGQAANGAPRTIFIAEKDERLQDVFREKFKEKGYRVLLAADPARALDRFRQQPYDVLIVDAGTTGESGLLVFERILKEADKDNRSCSGILMLADDQLDWKDRINKRDNQAVLVQPIKFKQLLQTVQELLGKK